MLQKTFLKKLKILLIVLMLLDGNFAISLSQAQTVIAQENSVKIFLDNFRSFISQISNNLDIKRILAETQEKLRQSKEDLNRKLQQLRDQMRENNRKIKANQEQQENQQADIDRTIDSQRQRLRDQQADQKQRMNDLRSRQQDLIRNSKSFRR